MADLRGVGTLMTDETELTTNSFDLFNVPHVENVTQHGFFVELSPVNSLTNNGPFEFHISRDPDHFIALHYTRLSGRIRVVKAADGKDFADSDAISTVNLFAHSLFKQIEAEVEGVPVNDRSTSTYPIKHLSKS